MPMKARTTSKKGRPSFAAIGVITVAMDQQTTPKPKTTFPPYLSAQIPPRIYTQEKTEKKLRLKFDPLWYRAESVGTRPG